MIGMNKWQHQKTEYKQQNNPNYRGGKEVPCDFCGKPIYRRPWELKKNKNHFCSTECHDNFRRKPEDENKLHIEDMRGHKHPRWNGVIKYCKVCNKELIGRDQRRRNYCSDECANNANRNILKGENHPEWKGGKVTLNCKWCNKEFQVSPGRKETSLYCSVACYRLGRRNRVTIQCKHCGKEVIVSAVRFNELNAQFCSITCCRSYNGKTSIESKVLLALKELEIEFIDEYRPSGTRRVYDFYLPKLNTLIEVDGDFWHYSEWAENNGSTKRDKEKTKWAIDNGFSFIRLREKDINEFGALSLLQEIFKKTF